MSNNRDAVMKDLELQWADHFHMRDQTWKTLGNSILFFLGIVGIKFSSDTTLVLLASYFALVVTALFGWAVAHHHRDRQKEKFEIIEKYEEVLGLSAIKESVLRKAKKELVHTALFIEVMQLALTAIGVFLIIGQVLK
jgi:hypothetical protein